MPIHRTDTINIGGITFMGPNAAEFAQTNVTDSADNSPQTLSLTATARTQVTLSAISLTFGSRTVGMKSPAKNIVFSNLHRSLTITDITFAEAIPAISPQTNAGDSSVASKARCIISVTFTPQACALGNDEHQRQRQH